MDIRKLQHVVIDALESVKGQQIDVFNTTGLTDLFDRVVIVTGTSNRHARSLAGGVRDKVKAAGGSVLSVEGEEVGEWVLVDLGDVVVHIMQPPIRAYYNLEELWGAKPVTLVRPVRKVSATASGKKAATRSRTPPRKKAGSTRGPVPSKKRAARRKAS